MRQIKSLAVLGDWIYADNLWHINRYSASMAFFVGLFVAFMPIPGQMVAAASLALLFRCNLPLSVGLVWITNPVTMPAIFYLAYKLGAMVIDVPMQKISFELSYHWLTHSLSAILATILAGLFIVRLVLWFSRLLCDQHTVADCAWPECYVSANVAESERQKY